MRAVTADQALDELYAAAPGAFTKTRDALAKRLKDEGDGAAAAKVKAARKPTQIAYVLNQLARRHPDDVAALVDVGRELARAQRKALRGGHAASELREAIARQREVVGDVTRKTASLMQDLGVASSGHLDEVAGALQAALVDPAVGAQLEEGRLDKVPAAAAGFPGAGAMLAPRGLAKTKAPRPPMPSKRERLREKREEQREAARRAADEAEARANDLAAQAAEAARTAKALRADADRLAAEARARAKEAARAESASKQALAAAKHARTSAARLASKADAA